MTVGWTNKRDGKEMDRERRKGYIKVIMKRNKLFCPISLTGHVLVVI
jgi:hypothetical protein